MPDQIVDTNFVLILKCKHVFGFINKFVLHRVESVRPYFSYLKSQLLNFIINHVYY